MTRDASGSIYRRKHWICRTCNQRIPERAAQTKHAGHKIAERQSRIWWISYRARLKGGGFEWRHDSSRSVHREDARRLLRDRTAAVDTGAAPTRDSLDAAATAALRASKDLRSYSVIERRLQKHVVPHFGGTRRVIDITAEDILDFRDARKKTGASNAEINREVDGLRKCFKAAKIMFPEEIKPLEESEPRGGFVAEEEYVAVASRLESHMRGVWAMHYLTGWRSAEILRMKWSYIVDGEIRLAGRKKNKKEFVRVLPIGAETQRLFEEQKRLIREVKTEWVFCFFADTPKGNKRITKAGSPISYSGWLHAFEKAREASGVRSDLIPHDCRRTVARRLLHIGIQESHAMQFIGHATSSIFRRYSLAGKRLAETKLLDTVKLPTIPSGTATDG